MNASQRSAAAAASWPQLVIGEPRLGSLAAEGHTQVLPSASASDFSQLAAAAVGSTARGTASPNGRPGWFTNNMLQAAWGCDKPTFSEALSGASGAYKLPADAVKKSLITTIEIDSKKTVIVAIPGTCIMADFVEDASFATKPIPGAVMPTGTKKSNGDHKVNVMSAGTLSRSPCMSAAT